MENFKTEFEITIKHTGSRLQDQHFQVEVSRATRELHIYTKTFDSYLMEVLLLRCVPDELGLEPYLDDTIPFMQRQPYGLWTTYLYMGAQRFKLVAAKQSIRAVDVCRLAITLTPFP